MALALPLEREMLIWITSKITKRCANGDVTGSLILMKYRCHVAHATVLCFVIGTYATWTTGVILMAIDFTINILGCIRLVYKIKYDPENLTTQNELLQDLALSELVEAYVPLSYCLVVGVAYYGPNGHIYGNILNSYWTYEAIDNINKTITSVMALFLVDFCSTLCATSILWLSCRIRFWKIFAEIQKEFVIPFSPVLGINFFRVNMLKHYILMHQDIYHKDVYKIWLNP